MMSFFDTSRLDEKIDGLEADLERAIEVAFDHGAVDWVRLNYPDYYRKRMAMRKNEPVAGRPTGANK